MKHIYVAIDDQSNESLIDDKLVDYFGLTFPKQIYKMSTAHNHCNNTIAGCQVTNLCLQSVVGNKLLHVAFLLSCRGLLDMRRDDATPDIVIGHDHLKKYARLFPDCDPTTHTMALLGRDCGDAMVARSQSGVEPSSTRLHWAWL